MFIYNLKLNEDKIFKTILGILLVIISLLIIYVCYILINKSTFKTSDYLRESNLYELNSSNHLLRDLEKTVIQSISEDACSLLQCILLPVYIEHLSGQILTFPSLGNLTLPFFISEEEQRKPTTTDL